jgi:hypothetical protein
MMTNDAITSDPPESMLDNGANQGNDNANDAYTDDGSQVSEAKSETAILSKKETQQIVWSKALVVLVIAVAAFSTFTGVYFYLRDSEAADFQVRVS